LKVLLIPWYFVTSDSSSLQQKKISKQVAPFKYSNWAGAFLKSIKLLSGVESQLTQFVAHPKRFLCKMLNTTDKNGDETMAPFVMNSNCGIFKSNKCFQWEIARKRFN
jgi:hypothetical protein